MKDNVVILNFVRAEILDNEPLLKRLSDNKIRNYVCNFSSALFKKYS
ncbi:hypothetical protein [Candidatus Coxiella mudrowiae]|nr:hypothetical protein [Candidatus Coxiella mudrowiae]